MHQYTLRFLAMVLSCSLGQASCLAQAATEKNYFVLLLDQDKTNDTDNYHASVFQEEYEAKQDVDLLYAIVNKDVPKEKLTAWLQKGAYKTWTLVSIEKQEFKSVDKDSLDTEDITTQSFLTSSEEIKAFLKKKIEVYTCTLLSNNAGKIGESKLIASNMDKLLKPTKTASPPIQPPGGQTFDAPPYQNKNKIPKQDSYAKYWVIAFGALCCIAWWLLRDTEEKRVKKSKKRGKKRRSERLYV